MARTDAAQKGAGVLAACLMSWARGDDDVDSQAGALVVAEFVLLVRSALKKKG